jgi:hypothetical protein
MGIESLFGIGRPDGGCANGFGRGGSSLRDEVKLKVGSVSSTGWVTQGMAAGHTNAAACRGHVGGASLAAVL